VRLSEIAADDGRGLLARAREEGWEGLIVKDGHSVYDSGRRTPAWRKLKLLHEQEFVIGGWTEPRQTRQHFGALLVGYYDDEGALRWAGSVGTGFDQHELERVSRQLDAIVTSRSPFADAFKTMEPAHWVRPRLVAQVRFAEWTSDGLLRQPVYLGLREDKAPKDVRREEPAGVGTPKLPSAGRYRRNRRTPPDDSVAARRPPTPSVTAPASRTRTKSGSKAARSQHATRTTKHTARDRPPTTRNGKSARPAAATKANAKPRGGTTTITARDREQIIDALDALERARKDGDLALPNGDTLHVTNLAKPFWPALGLSSCGGFPTVSAARRSTSSGIPRPRRPVCAAKSCRPRRTRSTRPVRVIG
jgi:hypothetical protein